MINLKENEKILIKDLQDQEKTCMEKYEKYAGLAKDPVLKDLFNTLKSDEEDHYNSLSQLMTGNVPAVNAENTGGKEYNPAPSYTGNINSQDKDNDCFLCTDSIATEKYVSSAYNFDLFQFGDPDARILLNHIQTEEQNHAEMLYKYKMANQMA